MHAQMSVNAALRARAVRAADVADDDAAAAAPPATVDAALLAMFAAADTVFTGEVTAVDRGEDVVTVRFVVEDGIRGASAGETYSLREWSGLWADNAARYSVGQHLLMLLHAPSVAGFASPLSDGAIPLNGDAVTGTADLRWIALHTTVTDAARLRSVAALRAAGGSAASADALMRTEAAETAAAQAAAKTRATLQSPVVLDPFDTVAAPPADDANAHVDRAVVVDRLHAWQQHAERAQ